MTINTTGKFFIKLSFSLKHSPIWSSYTTFLVALNHKLNKYTSCQRTTNINIILKSQYRTESNDTKNLFFGNQINKIHDLCRIRNKHGSTSQVLGVFLILRRSYFDKIFSRNIIQFTTKSFYSLPIEQYQIYDHLHHAKLHVENWKKLIIQKKKQHLLQ